LLNVCREREGKGRGREREGKRRERRGQRTDGEKGVRQKTERRRRKEEGGTKLKPTQVPYSKQRVLRSGKFSVTIDDSSKELDADLHVLEDA
jgi:hypothetical protein